MSTISQVSDVLGPEGLLANAIDQYEHRPEQLDMARAVERAFADGKSLIAEAGTGTGKTLAYLVPAVLSGRKVTVSTATKTLQEQIFYKDIPLLQDRLGLKFKATYLKGRANYLCLYKLERFRAAPIFSTQEESIWQEIDAWAGRTQTGDRSELQLPENTPVWNDLSTSSEACLGSRCPLYDSCFVTRMRKEAEHSDVLVVNHHLFFADLSLRHRGRKKDGILPDYDAVVFDEAHALEEAATEFFGVRVSTWRLNELSNDAVRAVEVTDPRARTLAPLLAELGARSEALAVRLPRALGLKREGTLRLTAEALEQVTSSTEGILDALTSMASLLADAEEAPVAVIGRRAQELKDELQFVLSLDSQDHVYWAEARGRGVFLRASPIDVSDELRSRLYENVSPVVFTSATLTTEGRFDYFARRMGLRLESDDENASGPQVRALSVASPFDFRSQAALYLPTHLPEPHDPGFVHAVVEEIIALAHLTGGRAFALFTSLRNMEEAYRLAKHRLPFQVLLQGELPKSALVERFRSEPSVLFAAHSFWEGVDVPGEALSLVIMDKLPFASPSDPVVASRIDQLRARGHEPFSAYQVPSAAITLRQGFGRLIRTRQDRGVVAMLDRRISQKMYGRVFLNSLPPARRLRNIEDVERWLTAAGVSRPRS